MCKETMSLPSSSKSLLVESLQTTSGLLSSLQSLSDDDEAVQAALPLYQHLKRLLSVSVRTGDWTSKESKLQYNVPDQGFHSIYEEMMNDFNRAEAAQRQLLEEQPAAVRPLGRESLTEVSHDFFILDNSLRETTVGQPRGHTLEEKHKIVDAIAESGLEEVILGAFGSKISVDSQIASRWTSLGKSFDSTWGFSSAYDVEPFDQEAIWHDFSGFVDKVKAGTVERETQDYYVPTLKAKTTFNEDESRLFEKAFKDFAPGAFGGMTAEEVLKQSEHVTGRIPMGLLMMAGYGICNAIIEVDPTYEKFDHQDCDMIQRLEFLMQWCRQHLPKRSNGEPSRVFVNFTDFANWKNSHEGGGLEKVMFLIYSLSKLPPKERPFGYMMEDPTSWLLPDEMGKYVRMVRLMMNRAGHHDGKFLVHIHMYFGLAEANVLACLANGADGVWAAMCKVGAQVGHACSTVTATNLVRVGHNHLAKRFDLKKMCKAAREIHSITTRAPCPTHEEVYGEFAFDVPFMMISVPHCRYALSMLLEHLGVEQRAVRINELSSVGEIEMAMRQTFGPPEETGWNPEYCQKMWNAIHNHLLTGLSRDYNSALGLGHLYGLVSKKRLPSKMTVMMLAHSTIPDHHPTVLEFITRWNRLCARYEGKELPLPGSLAKSCMMYAQPVTVTPRRRTIPFRYWIKDVVVHNHVMKPIPTLFKKYVVKLMTEHEGKLQDTNEPTVDFYDQILQLKLFIVEAESLGVLPLVDDFAVRKNHDFFFGEDHLWLREVRGSRPKKVNQLLRAHIDFYPRFYTKKGNHALLRCIRSAAKRVSENKAIADDLQWLREGEDRLALDVVTRDCTGMDMRMYRQYRSSRRLLRNTGSSELSNEKSGPISLMNRWGGRRQILRSSEFTTLSSEFKGSSEQERSGSHSKRRSRDRRRSSGFSDEFDLEDIMDDGDEDPTDKARDFYHRIHGMMTAEEENAAITEDFERFLEDELKKNPDPISEVHEDPPQETGPPEAGDPPEEGTGTGQKRRRRKRKKPRPSLFERLRRSLGKKKATTAPGSQQQ